MDNPEILITLGTQDAGRRHTKQETQHNTENYVKIINIMKKQYKLYYYPHSKKVR